MGYALLRPSCNAILVCSNQTAQGQSGYISHGHVSVLLRVERLRAQGERRANPSDVPRGGRKGRAFSNQKRRGPGNSSPGIPKVKSRRGGLGKAWGKHDNPQKSHRKIDDERRRAPFGEKGTWVWRRLFHGSRRRLRRREKERDEKMKKRRCRLSGDRLKRFVPVNVHFCSKLPEPKRNANQNDPTKQGQEPAKRTLAYGSPEAGGGLSCCFLLPFHDYEVRCRCVCLWKGTRSRKEKNAITYKYGSWIQIGVRQGKEGSKREKEDEDEDEDEKDEA